MSLKEAINYNLNLLENRPSVDLDEIRQKVLDRENKLTQIQKQSRLIQSTIEGLKDENSRLTEEIYEKIIKIKRYNEEKRILQSTIENGQPVLKKLEDEIQVLQNQIQSVPDGISEADIKALEEIKANLRAYTRLTGVMIDTSKTDRFEGFVVNPETHSVRRFACENNTPKDDIWEMIRSTMT